MLDNRTFVVVQRLTCTLTMHVFWLLSECLNGGWFLLVARKHSACKEPNHRMAADRYAWSHLSHVRYIRVLVILLGVHACVTDASLARSLETNVARLLDIRHVFPVTVIVLEMPVFLLISFGIKLPVIVYPRKPFHYIQMSVGFTWLINVGLHLCHQRSMSYRLRESYCNPLFYLGNEYS